LPLLRRARLTTGQQLGQRVTRSSKRGLLLALLGLRLLKLGKLDFRRLILVGLLLRRLLVLEECGKAAKSCHDAP
jgi:hypothetical protein